jgi:hypothetical protein
VSFSLDVVITSEGVNAVIQVYRDMLSSYQVGEKDATRINADKEPGTGIFLSRWVLWVLTIPKKYNSI